jgi:CubicO group peptidase (beta-lactamase class C family)
MPIQSTIGELLAAGRVPGAVVAWARGDGPAAVLPIGADAAGRPLAEDALLPVASITKLAAALAVLALVEDGRLTLDDALGRHMPAAEAAKDERVTIRRLLSHTSGLPLDVAPELAPYRPGLDWPALAAACAATGPVRAPGTYVQYSNTGYGLLAIVVERLTGKPFPAALAELVLGPLGIEAYLGAEPPRPPARLADVRGANAGGELEPYNSAFWRSLAAPWGGLITTASGALSLVRAFRTRPEAIANQTDNLPGGMAHPLLWDHCPWGLGPEIRGAKTPHWAPAGASPTSFGHVGASGAIAWCDPTADLAWAILGTRTADDGWLLRQGAAIGQAVLQHALRASGQ